MLFGRPLIMSARNYLSAREKNIAKVIDCLPNINQRKYLYSTGKDVTILSGNSVHVNRNLIFTYEVPFNNSDERSGTPFSDFFSESETGTPDFISEESDSSSGSTLQRNNAEASKALATEWEKIERTLYEEDGEKTAKPLLVEECQQWKQIHPQLRIIGKAIKLPEKKQLSCHLPPNHDEIIAMHYSDYEEFSESDERLSLSSTDVTPQNSPRTSEEHLEPKLSREKVSFHSLYNVDDNLTDSFCSLLHITPINIRNSPHKRQNSSILKSEMASSLWMKSSRADTSVNNDRSSAKSFISLDTRHLNNFAVSASERKKFNNRVITARSKDLARLEPLCSPEVPHNDINRLALSGTTSQFSVRKVSLPPLFLEEEKFKVSSISSAKKNNRIKKGFVKSLYHSDKVMH